MVHRFVMNIISEQFIRVSAPIPVWLLILVVWCSGVVDGVVVWCSGVVNGGVL